MKYRQWKIAEQSKSALASLLGEGVPYLVAAVLCGRGLSTREQATNFLSWHPKLLCDPYLMKDMDLAVERIRLALEKREKIAVYGDYDVDGITSASLLAHYLRSIGGDVEVYIPSRLTEGYGVNVPAVEKLHSEGVRLLITVDCGITAVEETLFAKNLGMDVIITDHHKCKEVLPDAIAVLDPHREDCPYPFKNLAGVGVALKVVMALAGAERSREILAEYADLAAVGTVADVMELLGENRTLVHIGLNQLKETRRVGLRALLEETGTQMNSISSTTVGYCLAPRINAAGRMGKASMAADLILTEDEEEARRLARELCDLNRERQAVELAIFEECVAELDKEERHDSLVLAGENWHQGVVGIVASRLSERYASPVFMIAMQGEKGKGSCRSYGGFNLFRSLEACSDLLEGFGGHALAAGFTILKENIPLFRQRMATLVSEDTGGEEQISTLDVDVAVDEISRLTVDGVSELSMLEPYGTGNAKPVFSLLGATITCMSDVGGGRHLKLRVAREGKSLDAIFFSFTKVQSGMQVGDMVDVAFSPQINDYRGSRTVQLHLLDIRHTKAIDSEEDMALYDSFCQGALISPEKAIKFIPKREQFAAFWQHLRRNGGELRGTAEDMAREIARDFPVTMSPVNLKICLDVLEENDLLKVKKAASAMYVRNNAVMGIKVNLEESPKILKLRQMAEN